MKLNPEQQRNLNIDRLRLYEKMADEVSIVREEMELQRQKLTDEAKVKIMRAWEREGYLAKPHIVEVKVEKKTPQAVLDYMKQKYEFEKYQRQVKQKEIRIQNKIDKAKQRKEYWCLWCKKRVKVNEWRAELQQKRNRVNKSIRLIGNCSECGKELRAFGGYVEA